MNSSVKEWKEFRSSILSIQKFIPENSFIATTGNMSCHLITKITCFYILEEVFNGLMAKITFLFQKLSFKFLKRRVSNRFSTTFDKIGQNKLN